MKVELKRRGTMFVALVLAVLIPWHMASHFHGFRGTSQTDWESISREGVLFALSLWTAWRNRRNATSISLEAKEWTIVKDGRTLYAGPPLAQDRISEDGVDFFLSPPGFKGEIRIPKRLIPCADADRFLRRSRPLGA